MTFDGCLTPCVLSYDINLLLQLKFYYHIVTGTVIAEWGRGLLIIHIVHSKFQFPSKVFLAYVTFVATVLILLLPEHFRMALVHY
jgi:hypothetical protein